MQEEACGRGRFASAYTTTQLRGASVQERAVVSSGGEESGGHCSDSQRAVVTWKGKAERQKRRRVRSSTTWGMRPAD